MQKLWKKMVIAVLGVAMASSQVAVMAQDRTEKADQYLIGAAEKLEMIVHIWGEVRNPGSFRVQDNINVLELISLAGGPTEYSNVSEVILTRGDAAYLQSADNAATAPLLASAEAKGYFPPQDPSDSHRAEKRVIKINLKEYLDKDHYKDLPKLQPGDVVRLKRNSWFRWQTALRIATQIAIVMQATYYFSRIDY